MRTIGLRRLACGVVLLGMLAGGCADPISTHEPVGSPCPSCHPLAGGETSDFGSKSACTLFTKSSLVDASEATALGFDVEPVRALIERPIDAKLRWQARETDGGSEAQGYQAQTVLHATLTVRSYLYERPDPDYCDGVTCSDPNADGTPIEARQEECEPLHFVGADIELETLDGAVSVSLRDDPENIGRDTVAVLRLDMDEDDYLGSTAQSDLLDVTGSLELFPEVPEPYVGSLFISFDFRPEATHGQLSVGVWPDWDNLGTDAGSKIAPGLSYYGPLVGDWSAE
jgi:hypothetical protein